MKEITLQNNFKTTLESNLPKIEKGQNNGDAFGKVLMNSIGEVNRLQEEADHAVKELTSGNEGDIHKTMIALKKADLSFQLMMQVRNKIVSAYEEIKRMQV